MRTHIGEVWKIAGRKLRVITMAWSTDCYTDAYFALPESFLARWLDRYIAYQQMSGTRLGRWIMADAKACGLEDGGRYEWWMLGWWSCLPYRLLGRIAIKVPRGLFAHAVYVTGRET